MTGHALARLTAHLNAASSRRRFVGRLTRAGAAAAVAVLGRGRAVAAQCAYGPATCQQGYVWREAYSGDVTCVDPGQRDQAAADNAAAAGRVDPANPPSCQPGYVWRDAYDGDAVCVEPWVRDQVAYDNGQAAARVEPSCNGGADVDYDVGDAGSAYTGDSDGDGLNDLDERSVYGTDPLNKNTDGDCLADGDEVAIGSDPTSYGGTGTAYVNEDGSVTIVPDPC